MKLDKPIRDIFLVSSLTVLILLCYLVGKGPLPLSTETEATSPSTKTEATFPSTITEATSPSIEVASDADELEIALAKASMPNRTLIITPVNGAWMEPNSLIDLFLESFRVGEGTHMLLNHLLIVGMDVKAFNRCKEIHPHCYELRTEGVDFSGEKFFMSPDYVKMTQTKILFLKTVVERRYNFVFTDADVMWLRNPFQRLSKGVDFQISCDDYNHNPHALSNHPNTGFSFVNANERTAKLYELWYAYTIRYPKIHDQNVFNRMKYSKNFTHIGLDILFLDTSYFGGFCEPKAKLEDVCTMHANCCKGLRAKIGDLRATLNDWVLFKSFNPNSPFELRRRREMGWTNKTECQDSLHHRKPYR
ncbi:hypothetical protein SUGI_0976410 [Cryptomeria japonica]|nr:hypothetical protein SUGI_0976410 [Cryptomeria japonica]